MKTSPIPSHGFEGLGITPQLLQILQRLHYKTPTPIQQKAIPFAVEGKDIIGIAQTGTGKTLAFAIPMLQRLGGNEGIGLIIAPTRELALQIDEVFKTLGRSLGLRTAVLIGGASMSRQIQEIRQKPDVFIVTPGRCIDHLNQRTLDLRSVTILVLDEADRMLDMGFEPQIKKILHAVPDNRQTMLFSATMPGEIVKIANTHMKAPVRVEIARSGTAAEKVTQEAFIVKTPDKIRLLERLLAEYQGSVLIFSRTKHGAKRITKGIRAMGHTTEELHSNCSLAQRKNALAGFKSGKYRTLVATDIASRGIDVTGIEVVINFDLPDHTEDYVHRIGRTARAGKTGHAISFVAPDQRRDIQNIERLTRTMLPIRGLPELPPHRAAPAVESETHNRFRQGSRSPNTRPHEFPRRGNNNSFGRSNRPPRRHKKF